MKIPLKKPTDEDEDEDKDQDEDDHESSSSLTNNIEKTINKAIQTELGPILDSLSKQVNINPFFKIPTQNKHDPLAEIIPRPHNLTLKGIFHGIFCKIIIDYIIKRFKIC